jgi:hypothetical protein
MTSKITNIHTQDFLFFDSFIHELFEDLGPVVIHPPSGTYFFPSVNVTITGGTSNSVFQYCAVFYSNGNEPTGCEQNFWFNFNSYVVFTSSLKLFVQVPFSISLLVGLIGLMMSSYFDDPHFISFADDRRVQCYYFHCSLLL